MQSKYIPIVLALAIGSAAVIGIGATGYFLDQDSRNTTGVPPIQNGETETIVPSVPEGEENAPSRETPTGWKKQNKTGFSVAAPSDFEVRNDSNEILALYKHGPTQRLGTEIYDGVLLNFERITLTQSSLSAEVDAHITESESNGTAQITKPKTAVTVAGYQGFMYEESGLGTFPIYVVQKNPQSKYAIRITTLVEDPKNQGFMPLSKEIMNTLEISE